MEAPQSSLVLSVPLALPSAQRIEELILQAAREVAGERLAWLSFREAAQYMGVTLRTFERKKTSLGIPVSTIGGVKRIARQDLDVLLIAHTIVPQGSILQFPTQLLKQAAKSAA